MSVRPAAAPNLTSPADMERMVAQAGLTLNAGQMADLALAWRQIVGLLARIPRARPLADDQAYAFRLPPPTLKPTAAKPAGPKTSGPKTSGPAPRPAKPRSKTAQA